MSLICAPLVRVTQRDLTHCLGYLVEMAEMGRMVHQGRMEEMAYQVLLVHQVSQPWMM